MESIFLTLISAVMEDCLWVFIIYIPLSDSSASFKGAVWRAETRPKMQEEACKNHNQELQIYFRSCGKYVAHALNLVLKFN